MSSEFELSTTFHQAIGGSTYGIVLSSNKMATTKEQEFDSSENNDI